MEKEKVYDSLDIVLDITDIASECCGADVVVWELQGTSDFFVCSQCAIECDWSLKKD
jgi:hypothetical protein